MGRLVDVYAAWATEWQVAMVVVLLLAIYQFMDLLFYHFVRLFHGYPNKAKDVASSDNCTCVDRTIEDVLDNDLKRLSINYHNTPLTTRDYDIMRQRSHAHYLQALSLKTKERPDADREEGEPEPATSDSDAATQR